MRVGRKAIDALFDVHHTQYSLGSASGVLCKLGRSSFDKCPGITESMAYGEES